MDGLCADNTVWANGMDGYFTIAIIGRKQELPAAVGGDIAGIGIEWWLLNELGRLWPGQDGSWQFRGSLAGRRTKIVAGDQRQEARGHLACPRWFETEGLLFQYQVKNGGVCGRH